MASKCKIMFVLTFVAAVCVSCSIRNKFVDTPNESAISIPCEESGKSDNYFFRAIGNATSSNINLARDKALAEAKTQLAKIIIDKTIFSANRYIKEIDVADKVTFVKKLENFANEAVDKTIGKCASVCEKYSENNGRYTVYVAVEIDKAIILEEIERLAVNDKTNFEKDKFESLFNE